MALGQERSAGMINLGAGLDDALRLFEAVAEALFASLRKARSSSALVMQLAPFQPAPCVAF